MRPPFAIQRRVRIAVFIGILMMNAMSGDPENGPAFECKRAADGQEIFDPFGSFIPAMGQQAVIAHADAPTARDQPEKDSNKESVPGKKPECSDGANVKSAHESGGDPVDLVVVASALEGFDLQGSVSVQVLSLP